MDHNAPEVGDTGQGVNVNIARSNIFNATVLQRHSKARCSFDNYAEHE